MKNRFEKLRKSGKSSGKSNEKRTKETGDSQQVQKKRTEECLEMPEGETEETCKEHIKVMKREMARPSNRSLAMVKELTVLTHAHRGELFLKETIPINQFLKEYPALKISAEVHVCRCQKVWFQ